MKACKQILSLIVIFISINSLHAYKKVEEVIFSEKGYDFTITVYVPDEGKGPFPVSFYVHGGGWGGGTSTRIPGSSPCSTAEFLTDELKIIYVGLSYRCHDQNGTFKESIRELEKGVNWVKERAQEFNADMSRIAIGGGSAGSPLAAILAQRVKNCKIYYGINGIYDFINRGEISGSWPSVERMKVYNVYEEADKQYASLVYNLSEKSPATLLLHGDADATINYTQAIRCSEKLKDKGIDHKVIIFPKTGHSFFYPRNPDPFIEGAMELTAFYAKYFKLENVDYKKVRKMLNEELVGYYPLESLTENDVIGHYTWAKKGIIITLKQGYKGEVIPGKDKQMIPFKYKFKDNEILFYDVKFNLFKSPFFVRKDKKAIYCFQGSAKRQREFKKINE